MTKLELRDMFILPALDIFEKEMNRGVVECEPFWDEAINHPKYPTSKAFDFLNKLENAMCSDEEATVFEVLVCAKLPDLANLLADWDNSSAVFDSK